MIDAKTLQDVSIFSDLSPEQLTNVAKAGSQRIVAEGELVFEKGSKSNEVFVLIEGRVQITIELSRSTEQAPVHTVLPGRIFGEFELVSDIERTANARAIKDSIFFILERDAFEQLAEKDPDLGYRVLRQLTKVLVGRIIKTTHELRASLMF
jgi:CRP-like cAMP-binding protein